MGRLSEFFDFSTAQLRFLMVLCSLAVLTSAYLLIRSYTTAGPEAMSLPVIMGDVDREFTGTFVLDPNTAPVDSLELLPGIGKVLADRIIEYRQHHAFERELDITEVKGIGPKLYDRLRPYLRVRRP
jgi:DNA uptake protein ComE-like DNA-binding protein